MNPLEAIARTAESRLRPVLLTTITTMAGLAPMVFGISVDFFNGGYTINSPSAMWWKQLSTAVVFGLGLATVLTLIVTPSLLAVRVWFSAGLSAFAQALRAWLGGSDSIAVRDSLLRRAARRAPAEDIDWTETAPSLRSIDGSAPRAAE
jgi:multidrug efflux pump